MTAVSQLRNDIRHLTSIANSDLAVLWAKLEQAAQAETPLNDILPSLIATYGSAAATIGADWYDDLREKVGARHHFTAIPADIADSGAYALVGYATHTATDWPAFKTIIQGGVQRRIANFARQTVTGSSIADPGARGWSRSGTGNCCDFCAMLIGRGAVYSEATADFEAHDHDECFAEPSWL